MNVATKADLKKIDDTFDAVARLIQLRKIADNAPDQDSRMAASQSMYFLVSWLEAEGVSQTLLEAIQSEWVA